MKIVQINISGSMGSTGKIVSALDHLLSIHGHDSYVLYGEGLKKTDRYLKVACKLYRKVQALYTRIFGCYGFEAYSASKRVLKLLDRIQPDIVHLHNIHSHDIHLGILLKYLKQKKIKTIWTFHDCWAFTGSCPHYSFIKCDKWKEDCRSCPQWHANSWLIDRNHELLRRKKELLMGLNLTIVTPSQWLADQVKQSFLKDSPLKVINNGIDLTVFKPMASNFRERYHCQNKKIVLGVAFGWGVRKGLDVFVQLAECLPQTYQIVLVGTDEKTEKQLPRDIITIQRTQNQQELAEIYTAADVFVNPTREEVLGLVNIEALACGTPVVTFDAGGSPECIDTTCGIVVPCDNIDAMVKAIRHVCENNPFLQDACYARARCFKQDEKYRAYLDVYTSL